MSAWARLAFVDVETTGLSPTENRIAEIGVVTVDADGRVEHWTTLLRTSSRGERSAPLGSSPYGTRDAPCFSDIAADLARRLDGRLFVAHNARFDHAFLRAEFERWGDEPVPGRGAAGDATAVAAAVQRLAEAGADTVVVQPTTDEPDPEAFVRFVAAEVRPLVTG